MTDKPSLTFLWNPPDENITHSVNVTFYATLARNHDEFWVMQPSNKINISVSGILFKICNKYTILEELILVYTMHASRYLGKTLFFAPEKLI